MNTKSVIIRSFEFKDKPRIIEILHSNCPKYFQATDEADLIVFLDSYADRNFLVVEDRTGIVGCGGHYARADKEMIGIAWVMFQRHAIGVRAFRFVADKLFTEIMTMVAQEPNKFEITINTTQVMEGLFSRYGFTATERTPGGFGEGLDHVVMIRSVK